MKKLLQSLFLLLFVAFQAIGQERTVTGKVTGADDGLPLPGVSVRVKNGSVGTTTGANGNFTLSVPSSVRTLTFSYLGYVTQDVNVGNSNTINVSLTSDLQQLSEVVVTGYGTEKRLEVTGAITSVKGSEIENLPVQTFDKALQGRAAGVQVTTNSGQPGSGITVNIRGVSTINGSTQPLYIVDGVQISAGGLSGQTTQNVLGSINPADIESIEVLKDAASASIYGSQAANGVVIVTTKRGKSGKTKVRASTQFGSSDLGNPYDLVDANQYYTLRKEAITNFATRRGEDPTAYIEDFASSAFGTPTPGSLESTDWYNAIFRSAPYSQYDLSASGGDDKTRFFISGAYNSTDGTVIASTYRRGTIRANLDHKITDKVSIEANINLAGIKSTGPTTQQGFFTNTPFTGALFTPPFNKILNADGTYAQPVLAYNLNLVQSLNEESRETATFQTVNNFAINYQIIPGLRLRGFAGIEFSDPKDYNYRPSSLPIYAANGGTGVEVFRRNINYNASTTASFAKSFNTKHNFSTLGGFEYRSTSGTTLGSGAQGFPSPLLTLLSSAATPTSTTSTFTGYKLASLLGNVKYDYEGKYLLSANARYDGSSRFGADKKFGLFYGVSAGWRITQEDFMQSTTSWLSDLKLRASYGLTGVQPQGDFGAISLYSVGGPYNGSSSLRPTQLANPNLTWEESAQVNLGLDFGIFNNRIAGSVDIYQKNNTQLILGRTLPSNSGFGSITENAGEVESKGIDLELVTRNLDGAFKWTTSFNIAFTENKLVSLNDGATNIGTAFVVGEPLGLLNTFRWAGVNPADGRPMYYNVNGDLTYRPVTVDRANIGDSNPDFFGGLGNTMSYKGLTFDVLFQYQYGNYTYLQTAQVLEASGAYYDNQVTSQLNRWTTPGQITAWPRPYDQSAEPGGYDPTNLSSRYVQNASYIRLKQVTLNYKLPTALTSKIRIPGASLFVQGLNLTTITNYRGDDPENTGNNLNAYPNPRTFTGGITLDL